MFVGSVVVALASPRGGGRRDSFRESQSVAVHQLGPAVRTEHGDCSKDDEKAMFDKIEEEKRAAEEEARKQREAEAAAAAEEEEDEDADDFDEDDDAEL